jgi:hypothetical protein
MLRKLMLRIFVCDSSLFLPNLKLLIKIKNTNSTKKTFILDLDTTVYEELNHVLHVISRSSLLYNLL